VQDEADKHKIKLILNISYSPDYNPIESAIYIAKQKIKMSETFFKFWMGIQMHEPELFAEMERDRKARPAKDLRAPPSPDDSE